MSTNIVKWNDTANELTAYCDDDKTKTEIGPAKWNDATNQLEIHCGGNVYQVKWNDVDNQLEARNVSAGCCECITLCGLTDDVNVQFTGIVDCGSTCCSVVNGNTYRCVYISANHWEYDNGTVIIALDCLGMGINRLTLKISPCCSGAGDHCFIANWSPGDCLPYSRNNELTCPGCAEDGSAYLSVAP